MAGLYHAQGCLSNPMHHRSSRSLAGSWSFDARFDSIDTTSSLAPGQCARDNVFNRSSSSGGSAKSSLAAAHRLAMEEKQPVRHVIVFKFSANATNDQITATTNAFRDLKNQIPGITSFEHGENVSSEGLNQGFNH